MFATFEGLTFSNSGTICSACFCCSRATFTNSILSLRKIGNPVPSWNVMSLRLTVSKSRLTLSTMNLRSSIVISFPTSSAVSSTGNSTPFSSIYIATAFSSPSTFIISPFSLYETSMSASAYSSLSFAKWNP